MERASYISDPDKQIITGILDHIAVIEERLLHIKAAEDFVDSNDGALGLDGIALRLQAIGENIRKLHKQQTIINEFPGVHWNDFIRFRDFLSHHYERLNHEIVFNICQKRTSLP